MISFKRTASTDPDFHSLVNLLDADLALRDGEEHAFYDQFNKIVHFRNVIIAYADNEPAGCGAFKEYAPERAEIKRMFVKPAFRGQGIGRNILHRLEIWAAENGFTSFILETGKKQPEAISLYKRSGYSITENYGQYAGVENSVCMRKTV